MCLAAVENLPNELAAKAINRSLKLWEAPAHWHCAIIGTCFSHDELVKIAKKTSFDIPTGKGAVYKMHSLMVGDADNSKGAGRLLQKALERKYKITLRKFSSVQSDEELEKLWHRSVQDGEFGSAFWALLSHPHASLDLKKYIYGEVHMFSHLEGGDKGDQAKELKKSRDAQTRLKEDLKAARKNLMNIQTSSCKKIKDLECQLENQMKQSQKAHELEERLMMLEEGQVMAKLEQRVETLSKRVIQESERVQYYKDKQVGLEAEIKSLKEDVKLRQDRILQRGGELFQQLHDAGGICADPHGHCTGNEDCMGNGDLCGRCIAYIGGQTKLAAHFRDHVEERNGEFLHHDGGLHDGQAKLLNIIRQADAVMFPVTCISHEASREIKQACIQHQKPFMPLRTKGLGAFRRGLDSLEGEFFEKMEVQSRNLTE